MKNNGFTLIELLAVIAILSMLALIAVPSAIEIYNEGIKKEMKIQESNVKDAANLYVEDYCTDRIDESLYCPSTYDDGIYDSASGLVTEKYVCLSSLQNAKDKYISDVRYKKDDCEGFVVYHLNEKTGTYDNPKTYLYCGYDGYRDKKYNYKYVTDDTISEDKYYPCVTAGRPQ